MQINLSTEPEEILKTMIRELPTEYYLFYKKYGGKKKYLKYEDDLLNTAIEEKESQSSDFNEHISLNGNRWVTYTNVIYYPKALYAQAFNMAFIYYETYGSCGAFFPMYPSIKKKAKGWQKPNGVIIYTSHFFLRMSERTGKAYRSKELIKEFISTMMGTPSQTDEDGDVIVKFKGGYGFGKEKSSSPKVVEIRTFLTNKQLNTKQKRKCEIIDAYYELMSDGMFIEEVSFGTIYNSCDSYEKMMKEAAPKLKAIRKLGMEREVILHGFINYCFSKLLMKMLNTKITLQQNTVICKMIEQPVANLVSKWVVINRKFTDEENEEFKQDFIEAAFKCVKKLGLKSINKESIAKHLDDMIKEGLEFKNKMID